MNPFEIRLELLKLANDVLSNNLSYEHQQKDVTWNAQKEYKAKLNEPPPPYPETKPITIEDIICEAEKMNKFIS